MTSVLFCSLIAIVFVYSKEREHVGEGAAPRGEGPVSEGLVSEGPVGPGRLVADEVASGRDERLGCLVPRTALPQDLQANTPRMNDNTHMLNSILFLLKMAMHDPHL